jgi:hypothetical protein
VRRAAFVLGVVLAGCNDDPTRPSFDISGTWSYEQVVQGGGFTCGDGGQLELTQNGATLGGTLSGRGGCESTSVAIDYFRQDTVTNGQIEENAVSFTAGSCRYEGIAVGNPVTQAGGTATCTNLGSTNTTTTGSWELRR